MKVRLWIGERALAQLLEATDEPLGHAFDVGIYIDLEVEVVAEGNLLTHHRWLQHIQTLDDHDIWRFDDYLGTRHDVVAQVRVNRGRDPFDTRLDVGNKLEQSQAVV